MYGLLSGYQYFGGTCYLSLHPEDGGAKCQKAIIFIATAVKTSDIT
jgi:hypothetical protein